MSSDNFILTVEAPKRDGTGKEWLVADVFLSGFDYDAWNNHDRDGIIMELACYMHARNLIGRYDSSETAEAAEATFQGIVEYDSSTYVINFPLPNEEEIAEAKARWKADKPRRECQNKIDLIRVHIANLEEAISFFPIGTQRLKNEIAEFENSENGIWRKMAKKIKKEELPERQAEFARMKTELARLRIELEEAQTELSWYAPNTPTLQPSHLL